MNDGYGFIATFAIGVLLGGIFTYMSLNYDWERAIIKRDYGLYCAQTGEFSFKGECENDIGKN